MVIKQCCVAFIATLLVFGEVARGQSPAKSNELLTYFDRLPAVAADMNEAHDQYSPKGKISPAKQYAEIINGQINLLADISDHKSRLLSMLAGIERYEKEGRQYNFIKAEEANRKDKDLEVKFREINSSMLWAFDEFNRMIGGPVDSIFKLNLPGMDRTALQLRVYQKYVPVLIKNMKKYTVAVTNLLEKKGYNKVLDLQETTHPYYIQLLDIRGLIFDRVRMINQIIDGINNLAAEMVDICSKNPDACK